MTFNEVYQNEELRNSHLFVNVPTPFSDFSPREVILWFEDHIVVMGDYNDVNREALTGDDPDGNRLIKVPSDVVYEIFTEDQLEKFECDVEVLH